MINEEYTDISLYTSEAELFAIKLVNGHHIAETFRTFAREESDHARALQAIVGSEERSHPRIISSGDSLRNCLHRHKEREATSVTFYKHLIKLETVPERKLLFKGILEQELEHLRAVSEYLEWLNR